MISQGEFSQYLMTSGTRCTDKLEEVPPPVWTGISHQSQNQPSTLLKLAIPFTVMGQLWASPRKVHLASHLPQGQDLEQASY